MCTPTLTPLRRQFLDIKAQHPEALLFFRLGDFYELFDRDAEVAAAELEIVLTTRDFGRNGRFPMCGVPHHAAPTYIARLVNAGYRVAVCDQVGTPGNGLVERMVTKVITPGTVVDESMLQPETNNYLAVIVSYGSANGFAYADVTTGEFAATEISHEQVSAEVSRVSPRETLVFGDVDVFGSVTGPQWMIDGDAPAEALRRHFRVQSLDGLGLDGRPAALMAAGALLAYVSEADPQALHVLADLHAYSASSHMELDPATRANLELEPLNRSARREGSMLGVLDRTRTPMGARLLRRRLCRPSLDRQIIEDRLNLVEALLANAQCREELSGLLKGVGDLERLANRILRRVATVEDIRRVLTSLEAVASVYVVLAPMNSVFAQIRDHINCSQDAAALITNAIHDGDRTIRPGYSTELDRLVANADSARHWIANLESRERERLGIKTLKVRFNRVFGYYVEVSRSQADKMPEIYERRQTLSNAERYITPELKEHEAQVLNAEEQINVIEGALFSEIIERLAEWAPQMLDSGAAIAELDVARSLSEVAERQSYTRPKFMDTASIHIESGRHPVVETSQQEAFVPNDVTLDPDSRQILVLTGPNMAGKSTYLRQTALIVLMAQIGSFVPAASATLGIVDRIFTRVGARDDIAAGSSTFMVEMLELAAILAQATPRSLLVLDEIGRGTSTYDGIAVARSVIEHLHHHPRLRAQTIFATHYHELTAVADVLPRVCNANVAVAERGEQVVFLRRIIDGPADRSYGVHVARLAGLPPSVIRRARDLLAAFEQEAPAGSRTIPAQLPMLPPEDHPVVTHLRTIDPEQLSPLDALSKLYELCQEADA